MAVVDTTSPGYIAALDGLTTTFDQFKSIYSPSVKGMTGDQLKQLRQVDPLFAKFVQISQELHKLAERAGVFE